MSMLNNRHWIGFNGEPLTGRVPPELRVYGPELTGAQLGEVYHIYKLFTDACMVALGDHHVRNRVLSDGSRVRCTSFMGRDTVQVWTSGEVDYDKLPHGIGVCFVDLDLQPVPGYSVELSSGSVAPKELILVPGTRIDPDSGLPVSTGFWRVVYVNGLVGGQGLWVNSDRTFWMSYTSANPSVIDQDRHAQECAGPAYYNGAIIPYDPDWELETPMLIDGVWANGGFFGNRPFILGGGGTYFEQGDGEVGILLSRNGGVAKSKVLITPTRIQKDPSSSAVFATPSLEANKTYLNASYGAPSPEFTVKPDATSAVALLREYPEDTTADRWLLTRTVDVREETVADTVTALPRVASDPVTVGEIRENIFSRTVVQNEPETRELTDSFGTNTFVLGKGVAVTSTRRTEGETTASDHIDYIVDAFHSFSGELVICRATLSTFVTFSQNATLTVSRPIAGEIGFPLSITSEESENESWRNTLTWGADRSLYINEKNFWIEKTRYILTNFYSQVTTSEILRWWDSGALQASALSSTSTSTKGTFLDVACMKRDVLYLDRYFDLIVYVEWEWFEAQGSSDVSTLFEWRPTMPEVNTGPLTRTADVKLKVELNGEVVFSEALEIGESDRPLYATIPTFTLSSEDEAQSVDDIEYSTPYAQMTYPTSDPLVMQYVQQTANYTYGSTPGLIKKKKIHLQSMSAPNEFSGTPTPGTWCGGSTVSRRCHVQIARDPVTMAVAINVLWHKDPARPQSWFFVVDQTGLKNLSDILNIPGEKIRPVTLVSI